MTASNGRRTVRRNANALAVKNGMATPDHVYIDCPFCGERHLHGFDEDMRQGDSHRLSHCTTRSRLASGYDQWEHLGYDISWTDQGPVALADEYSRPKAKRE